MRFAGTSSIGRLAMRMAGLFAPPYKARRYLARLGRQGYLAPGVSIHCKNLFLGSNVFLGDRVTIWALDKSCEVTIGSRSYIHQDCIIEAGNGGSLIIGEDTHIQPRCQISAYAGPINIGNSVQIAPNCAFYPYDHGYLPTEPISKQPLKTKGGIIIEDDVWLGFGVIVLDGVKIGKGAVIGAGSVVTQDIPERAIASGMPARIIMIRDNFG
jgi:acetyltransferase-like isoleucine patch superfamily enzyme